MMRQFIDKWYGDECPYWTWPATIFGIGGAVVVGLWIINALNLAECERKGGNTMKENVCYHVTMRRID